MISGVPIETRAKLLRQHGTFALAYSATFQPEIEHFGDERGFIAYRRVRGTVQALADPIAPAEHWPALIEAFLREKGGVAWWQISHPCAKILSDIGYTVNQIGVEWRIDLTSYTFGGPMKRSFRRAAARLNERQDTVVEASFATFEPEALNSVSQEWRATRSVKHRELTFLVRPVVLTDELDVRKLVVLDREGHLVAFAIFDPVYHHDKVIGYLCSARRRRAASHPLTGYAIMRRAIEVFRAEGRSHLSLGLAPAAIGFDEAFKYNRTVRRTLDFIYRSRFFNRYVYPLRGLNEHKESYGGVTEPSYFAFNRAPGVEHLRKLAIACSVY
ncbi:MAG TPA: DUF2156 domain-containing protein [Stellaceae bacterium]|nr:DUF2156 domain-containing protein [Stellaceae bacterium]